MADISKSLAGTRQRENFITLVESFNQINDVQEKIAQSGGKAEEVFNSVYGESTEARITDVKQNIQLFWTETLNSNAINSFLDKINKVIEGLRVFRDMTTGAKIGMIALGATAFKIATNFITIGSAITKAKVAGESLTVLDGIIKTLIGTELTMKGVTTTLSATLSALFKTPAGLAFMGLAIAVGVATKVIINHVQHQAELKQQTEQLTTEYNNLTTAMLNNNTAQAKSSTDNLKKSQKDLQDLLKQRVDLENKLSDVNLDEASIMSYTQELDKTNTTIKEQIKVLQDAGFQVDAHTGSITQLTEAQYFLENSKMVETIKQQSIEEFNNREEIVKLAQEYISLTKIQDRNAEQNARMSELARILNGDIYGLTLTRDAEGNVIIGNTQLLNDQIGVMNSESGTVEALTNVKLNSVKSWASAEYDKTKITYEQAQQRIKTYIEEAEAMSQIMKATAPKEVSMSSSFNDRINAQLFNANNSVAYAQAKKEYDSKQKQISDLNGIIRQINSQFGNVSIPKPSLSKPSYTAPSSSGSSKGSSGSSKSPSSSKSSKSPSSSSKSSQTYTFNGAEVDKYQSQLQTVDDALQKIDDKIAEINQLKSNAESIDSESNYSEILKIQNQLLDEQINKQNTLTSKHDEISKLKDTITQDIYKNWGKLKGKDLTKFTQTDWDNYLTQFYGKDRTFKNEADKKRYDDGMKLFQQLVKDYQDTTNKLNEIDDERLKQVEIVNNAIKDKWESQINVYDEDFNKQSKYIDELSTRLDFANRSDESSIRNRLDIMYELIAKKEEYLKQIYKARDELLEQQKSLKEGSLEWDLINDTVETYNANIKDATNSLLDQKDILSQSIQEMTDTAVSMYDKVYNALVKKYDKEKEDELAKIDEELKQSTEKEDGLIKLYNAKIENLKAELDRLKDETKDEQDILNAKKSELELWKKDDSIFAQGKIQELEKDIADREKDLKIKAKEQELKEAEESLKTEEEKYDKLKKEKEDYYETTLKDEKKLHEETRKIMQGGQDEILNLLYKYDERYASLGELLGSSFTNPFLEELEKAKKALEDLKLINKEIEQEKIKESLKTSTVVNVSNNGKTANMSDGSKVDLGGLYSNSEYRALGQKWLDAKESGDTASAQKYEQQARDYASKYASFDTGGMTGSWGNEGKLAVLHEKELILNKSDTANMLKALNVSQSLVDTFKNITMPNILSDISFKLPDLSKLNKSSNNYNSPLVENKIYMTNNTPFEVEDNMDNMNRAIIKQLGLAGVNTPL